MTRLPVLFAGLILLTGCASTHSTSPELAFSTPIENDRTSYASALECLNQTLAKNPKKPSFGVLSFPDSTGKANFTSDSGTGYFSTQGEADLLIVALKVAGVRVIDVSPQYRQYLDWILGKGSSKVLGDREQHIVHDQNPAQQHTVNFLPVEQGTLLDVVPDYMVLGSIPTLDFDSGSEVDVSYAGVGGGAGTSGIYVTMSIRTVRVAEKETLPDSSTRDMWRGEVVSAFGLRKKIQNPQEYFSGNHFVGSTTRASLLSVNVSLGQREAIQYSERVMADAAAYHLVSEITGNPSCDAKLPHHERQRVSGGVELRASD